MWWYPSEQFGGILPNNVVASFRTMWWHTSEQFGGILPNNVVASFRTIWWHPSAFCLPLYSSASQQAFFLQDFFPKFIFEFSC